MHRWAPKVRVADLLSPDRFTRVTFCWFEVPEGGNETVTVTRFRPGHPPTDSYTRIAARALWDEYRRAGFTVAYVPGYGGPA